MDIVFLGGIFSSSEAEMIINDSIGPIQNAADSLQKKYLDGLAENESVNSLSVINLPFIGGYPGSYKEKTFTPRAKKSNYNGVKVDNIKFINVKGFKHMARFWGAFVSIRTILKYKKDIKVICYSMHLPFLLACYINKIFNSRIKFYVIIPDLPEYMSERVGINAFFYRLVNRLSYSIVNKSSGISVITNAMVNRFSKNLNHVLIEGISSSERFYYNMGDEYLSFYCSEPFFLYSGTLDRRYGIRNLIESYSDSGVSNVKLYICGDGNDRDYVVEKSNDIKNVIYLGQLEREKVLALQSMALALVNPRSNNDEFTKYSFPSKVLEYMSSGVPVIMYKLDGIPSEYDSLYFKVEDEGDLKYVLKKVSGFSKEYLFECGLKAKEFVSEHKCASKQVSKLVSIMKV
ncbi:glycosyltransferase family 4 protein [Vibrio sp. S17_S38]|uniref:glycosyltransferase n=1 Tax=Vibrio sp. S17_S38 TaxID=2720229 RepID=UPI001681BA1C|nr:glycosyltransferase [Vibrio sp. S17_S38]MBD1573265.1 glycosyltransferase family 4 protein [Vibrio sp. S17_S38]